MDMMKRGEELKPKWLTTPNILSAKTASKVKEVINLNPRVTVSEKLDGSNLCISSKRWVGTRNVILIQDLKTENLGKIKFNRASLSSLEKGDELPIILGLTGGSGPARVRGHVKSMYSAAETLNGRRV